MTTAGPVAATSVLRTPVTSVDPAAPEPVEPVAAAAPRTRVLRRRTVRRTRPVGPAPLASTALLLLGVLLLALLAQLLVIGALVHGRDQQVAYDELRLRLAEATAPVGQTDLDGNLLEPGTPVALLRIPAIGVDEVVLEGTTSGVLTSGPGHRRDTVLPGQAGTAVVLGRKAGYGGPFADVEQLRAGDEITAITGQGEATYRVTGIRRAGDPQPAPLERGDGRLTLVTAAGAPLVPSGVVRVDAELVTDAQPTPARVIGPGSLPEAEQPLQGDPGAWINVVLWGQALVAAALATTWLRARWGRRQVWVVAVPVLGVLLVAVADSTVRLLPNLI